jgi:hypothetical protein
VPPAILWPRRPDTTHNPLHRLGQSPLRLPLVGIHQKEKTEVLRFPGFRLTVNLNCRPAGFNSFSLKFAHSHNTHTNLCAAGLTKMAVSKRAKVLLAGLVQVLLLVVGVCLQAVAAAESQLPSPTVVAEFVSLNYTWDSTHTYSSYVSSKKFTVENCLMAGINVVSENDIYVTVPRWRTGIPATLNKLDMTTKTLTPFPSWEIQEEGKTGCIQSVQSMTIDKQNRMWVIDTARRNFFAPIGAVAGQPAVWIFNMGDNSVVTKYFFPESVVSSTESFLNDIVIDERNYVAYLSDAWGSGAIIMLDIFNGVSRRYAGPSTKNDPSYSLSVNGVNYGKRIFTTPIDGIAITDDYSAVFYCQVQGTTLYRLPTAVLANTTLSNSQIDSYVQTIGTKEPSDGMKYLNGKLYWGSLTTSTYYAMTIDATSTPSMSTATVASVDQEKMEWIDTFSKDLSGTNPNKLWFVSNRLDKYSVKSMDFSGKEGANMRILSIDV